MLDFESSKLKFKFNGEVKEITFPTAYQWGVYQKNIQAVEKDDGCGLIEAGLNFFVKLGLDEDTAKKLESHHIEGLLKALTEKKS
jgi:hypothetical protein